MENTFAEKGNIALLADYRKPMKHPLLVELFNHWEELRGSRIAPLRSEIDPRRIENALEHAFILEQVAAGEPRCRVAGMRLSDLMGMEMRSMPITALIAPEGRDAFSSILKRMFTNPEIVELQLSAAEGTALSAEMLLLPMKNDMGTVSRILGAVITTGLLAAPPNRFLISAKKITRIIASDGAGAHQAMAGFAEPANGFAARTDPGAPPERLRGYLRLVKTDD